MPGYILVVEDNPDDVDLTYIKFREIGNKNIITFAPDYQSAVDHLNTARPELVILDLKLQPGEPGGLDVLRYIRADVVLKDLPVIVLTVSEEQADLIESYRLGVNAYLRKPIEPMPLFDAIISLKIPWSVGGK
jgi:two-component system, response regulator